MTYSKSVESKKRKRIPSFSREYRPKLESLPAFSTAADQAQLIFIN